MVWRRPQRQSQQVGPRWRCQGLYIWPWVPLSSRPSVTCTSWAISSRAARIWGSRVALESRQRFARHRPEHTVCRPRSRRSLHTGQPVGWRQSPRRRAADWSATASLAGGRRRCPGGGPGAPGAWPRAGGPPGWPAASTSCQTPCTGRIRFGSTVHPPASSTARERATSSSTCAVSLHGAIGLARRAMRT